MKDGWTDSAAAWISSMGENGVTGDWSRENILDPSMLDRVKRENFKTALDVGCGEGRFCRILQRMGIKATGIDPTLPLLDAARARDPEGEYLKAKAEALPFDDNSFDLVISYMTLIDIPGYREAIAEMARVVRSGGTILVANLSGLSTANPNGGWLKDDEGRPISWNIDNYLSEYAIQSEWDTISIQNWHRPLSSYMQAFLAQGLTLTHFDEPKPVDPSQERAKRYARAPWFILMEWRA